MNLFCQQIMALTNQVTNNSLNWYKKVPIWSCSHWTAEVWPQVLKESVSYILKPVQQSCPQRFYSLWYIYEHHAQRMAHVEQGVLTFLSSNQGIFLWQIIDFHGVLCGSFAASKFICILYTFYFWRFCWAKHSDFNHSIFVQF